MRQLLMISDIPWLCGSGGRGHHVDNERDVEHHDVVLMCLFCLKTERGRNDDWGRVEADRYNVS